MTAVDFLKTAAAVFGGVICVCLTVIITMVTAEEVSKHIKGGRRNGKN